MRIVTARRVSQAFFLVLLVWLCIVSTPGERWFQQRGWPINWMLQLDPLVAVGVGMAAGALTAGLLWALVTVAITVVLGRAFCGWVCPLGTIHQAVGWLGKRGRSLSNKIEASEYRKGQAVKYVILAVMLGMAAGSLLLGLIRTWRTAPAAAALIAAGAMAAVAFLSLRRAVATRVKAAAWTLIIIGVWLIMGLIIPAEATSAVTLQTGLLDPIPLIHRSLQLVVLPLVDSLSRGLWPTQRFTADAAFVGAIFLGAVLANLILPRFFCRFICPLGALLGVLGRFALWRVGRSEAKCVNCRMCRADCQGACDPPGEIRTPECVLCMNCLNQCPRGAMTYQTRRSIGGDRPAPDISRRGVLLSLASGVAAVPILRLAGNLSTDWNSAVIRPPGSLTEQEFLTRCLKCGQCMRVCPTNVIQPAGLAGGLEGLWTPTLNNRIGTSGCQLNCVSCGWACPTGAIRPIRLDEKLGRGKFAQRGPIRLGTAFVDRGRCLPWAMSTPCIVCEENCPVSPKAIFGREAYETVRNGALTVREGGPMHVLLAGAMPTEGTWATGDYFVRRADQADEEPRRILEQTADTIRIDPASAWTSPPAAGSYVQVQLRLQRPYVDPSKCIGCGVCEHECPVSGRRAIRVTAENETRSRDRSLLL